MAMDAGTIKGYLDLDIAGFVDGLSEAGSKSESFLRDTESKFNGSGNKITSSMSKVGNGMTAALTTPILGAGAAALTSASQYETAGARMQASLGLTADEAEKLIDVASDVYTAGFGQSLDDVVTTLTEVRQRIGDVNDADLTYVTTGVQNLADLFDMDVGESINGVRVLMDNFGLSAQEAMDLFAAGAQNGLNYSDELGDNLAEYGPRFSQMGFSAQEYFQILQNGCDNGAYKLDKVNDFLNEFQTSLNDGRMDEQIGNFSQSTQDLFNEWKNGSATGKEVYEAVIGDLAGMTDSYKQAQVASALWSSLGEDNAMGMITAMTDVGNTYDDVAGKSQDMADTAQSSLGSQFTQIIRDIQDCLADLGSTGTGPLTDLFNAVKGVVEWFKNLDDGTKQTIATVALVVAAIGPLSAIIGTVGGAITQVVGIISKIGPAISTVLGIVTKIGPVLAGPVGIVVAAVTTIIGIIVALVTNVGGCRDALFSFFEGVGEFFSGLWDAIVQGVTEFGTWLGETFTGIWTSITEGITAAWNGIVEFFSGIWEGIVSVAQTVWDAYTTYLQTVWNAISTAAQTIFNAVADFFSGLWNGIKSVVETVWNAISGFVSSLWNGIKSTAETVFNGIKDAINTVLTTIHSIFQNIWNTISSVVSSVWNTIKSTVSNAVNGVKNTISNVLNTIKSVWSNAWNTVTSFLNNAWNNIKNGVSNGINGVLNFVRNIPSQILSALGNVGSLLLNAGKSIINGLWNGMKNAISGVFNWVGGIANRILSLKGPEEYDKKLLIKPGEWIIQGLGEGLEDEFGSIEDQVSGMADRIASSFSDDISKVPVDLEANMPSDEAIGKLKDTAKLLDDVSKSTSFVGADKYDPSQMIGSGIDYEMLAKTMVGFMQDYPINNYVNVEMEDGDVIMDGERVGRKVAPVVSRVQARKAKGDGKN